VRVVESPEVSDLVVSDIFLKQSEDGMAIGWSLVMLAEPCSHRHVLPLCLFDPRQ
jgi:hypothetical protein